MNRSVLAALLVFVSISALSQSKDSPCWKTAMTQFDMNRCAGEDASAADTELNRVYQKLLLRVKGDDNATNKLRGAQRAWIAFRDAQIEALFPAADKQGEYGSMYPLCHSKVTTVITKERIAQLRRMLEEKDPCEMSSDNKK
jgi:uncharacterized protein YecT (DUF1311 family)